MRNGVLEERTTLDLMLVVKVELMRAMKERPPKDILTYSANLWAWETLFDFLDEHAEENPYSVLEAFMHKMEAWHMQSVSEDVKVAFSMAYDNAQMIYDQLFS